MTVIVNSSVEMYENNQIKCNKMEYAYRGKNVGWV